jgi:hypothetical protein
MDQRGSGIFGMREQDVRRLDYKPAVYCAAIHRVVAAAPFRKSRLNLHHIYIPNKSNTVFRGQGLTMLFNSSSFLNQ